VDWSPIPWRSTRYPGVSIHFYASDRRTGRALALIRMEPGHGYPEHRHRGDELVAVLQGTYRDHLGEHAAGSAACYADGTTHAPVGGGGSESPACILLALAHEGITFLAG
jgi:anti-sigma factor ChrR (cupin superfamily)